MILKLSEKIWNIKNKTQKKFILVLEFLINSIIFTLKMSIYMNTEFGSRMALAVQSKKLIIIKDCRPFTFINNLYLIDSNLQICNLVAAVCFDNSSH